jgi:hypothetical protein
MDGPPDILSSEPHAPRGLRRPAILGLLLACLAVIAYLALLAVRQHDTINHLRAAPRITPGQAPPAPVVSGNAMFTLPPTAGGSFSVVAVTISPRPGSAPLTWLFIYGRHAGPGQRYGVVEDTCGGQYVNPSDLADGTADRRGDLTIVAPALDLSPSASGVWIMVYRWDDGAPLGGVQGPLTGTGARTFRTAPRC